MVIKPTVGRVVWYWPSEYEKEDMVCRDVEQPFAATVAFVWHDRMVNLIVADHDGKTWARTSVILKQEGDEVSGEQGRFAEWMPYQVGQAKKHEGESA